MTEYSDLIQRSFGRNNPALPITVGNIDEDPDKAQRAMDLATRLGRPPVEVLNDMGLLLTPIRERDIGLKSIKELITRLEGKTPADLMLDIWGRADGTPRNMYDAIIKFMEIWYQEFTRVHHGSEGSTK